MPKHAVKLLSAASFLRWAPGFAILFAAGCDSSGDIGATNSEFGSTARSGDDAATPTYGGSFSGDGGRGEGGSRCENLCLKQKACPGGGTTSLSGTVFDPAGKVPLYNVIVYVPNAPVAKITHGASCDRCGDVSGSPLVSAITDAAGHFLLTNVPVGSNIPLIVQVGKWRRQLTIANVPECTDTQLPASQTRLPKNQSEGDIPKIALTTGGADALECFLRKVGLEDSEFSGGGGAGSVHLYRGSPQATSGMRATSAFDAAHGGSTLGSAQTLWSDAKNLQAYDMLLLSCEGHTYSSTKPQSALDALYTYTTLGGRVFASHWHRYWFSPTADLTSTPLLATSPFPNLGVWLDVDPFPESIQATVNTSFPKGQAMQTWLGNVGALQSGKLPINGARDNLESVNSVNAQSWITYGSPTAVEYMSFNVPLGVAEDKQCGRVVYSDLHVSAGVGDQPGAAWPAGCVTTELSAQEKALEFMLFDLSACVQSDSRPPSSPSIQ